MPTVEELYQNVLGRAPDPGGLSFWQNYMGSSIDPSEIAAFTAAAQAEKPGAAYNPASPTLNLGYSPGVTGPAKFDASNTLVSPAATPPLTGLPANYPTYGPIGPVQRPIDPTPVKQTPLPTLNLTPVSSTTGQPITNQPVTNPPTGTTMPNQTSSSGGITQGSPLPNITTSQQQITAAPNWYTDYLSNLAQQGTQAGKGAQFVGASPLQQQAFNLTGQQVGAYTPTLQQATNLASQVGSTDVAQNVANFMNPYTQQVVEQLGTMGKRNIRDVLAPQATAAAVGSGQFGSTRGARVLGDVINRGLSDLSSSQLQALQTGYTQALNAAQQQQANRLASSQLLGNLAQTGQGLNLADINALSTLGAQQQQIGLAEELFPLQVAAQQAGLLRGYTVPTSVASTYTGPIPGAYSASPLQQIAGITSLLGALTTPGQTGGTTPLENIIKGVSGLFPSFGGSSDGGGGSSGGGFEFPGIEYLPGGGYRTSAGDIIDPSDFSDLF